MKKQILFSSLVACAAILSVRGAEPAYANTYHPLKLPIGAWNDLTTWYNDTTKSAATAIPGANDCVNLNQNGRSVNADGCAVEYSRMNVGVGVNVAAGVYQTGGSLKSGYWTFVGSGGSAGVMCLTNVDAVMSGYRLSVGNQAQNSTIPADSLFQMRGGSLRTDYTDGLLTSTWGRNNGTSTLDFDGTDWQNTAAAVKIGFGSINTNRFLFRNGTFLNDSGFLLGANVQNWGAASARGYDEVIFENAVWTNKDEVTLGASLQHKTRLVISNTVFAATKNVANKSTFSMGAVGDADDTLEIISCPQFTTAKNISVGAGTNSTSRIVVKGQKGALPSATAILNGVSFNGNPFRTYEVEIVDSDYAPTANFSVSSATNQTRRWTFRECDSLDFGSRTITVNNDRPGSAALTFIASHMTSQAAITGATGIGATNATLRLVDSTVETSSDTFLANNGGTAHCRLVVDGGSSLLKTSNFHIPRQGYGELIITNGASVEANQVFGPNMTGSEGHYFIDGNFKVKTKMAACNQPGSTGEIVQVSGVFDCSQATSMTFGNNDAKIHYVLKGGEFKGNPAYATYFAGGDNAEALLDLQGGTFATKCFTQPNESASFTIRFDGGTLKALAAVAGNLAFIPSLVRTSVCDGGAVIDLNGFSGIRVNAGFLHASEASEKDGGLRIRGAGSVVLTGTSTFTGDVIVEEGTLDMSGATFALGPNAVLGGAGTLKTPAAGLTVNGTFTVDPEKAVGPLTVQGTVTFGADARVTVTDASKLDAERTYVLLEATTLGGPVPALDDALAAHWCVRTKNGRLTLSPNRGLLILFH